LHVNSIWKQSTPIRLADACDLALAFGILLEEKAADRAILSLRQISSYNEKKDQHDLLQGYTERAQTPATQCRRPKKKTQLQILMSIM